MSANTIKTVAAVLVAMVAAACGGQHVDSDGKGGFEDPTEGDATPTATATAAPTAVPNRAPTTPVLTLSTSLIYAPTVVTVSAESTDPDGDGVSYDWTVAQVNDDGSAVALEAITSHDATVTIAVKVPAPAGTFTVRCIARDASLESDAAEEARAVSANQAGNDDHTGNPAIPLATKFDPMNICRQAPSLCNASAIMDGSTFHVTLPTPTDVHPDEFLGAISEMPWGAYRAETTVNVDDLSTRYALWNGLTPSMNVLLGMDENGGGYALNVFAVMTGGNSPAHVTYTWNWSVTALAADAMHADAMLHGSVMAAGTLASAPTSILASIRNGQLAARVNGVNLPAISAANVAGTRIAMGSRNVAAMLSNVHVALMP